MNKLLRLFGFLVVLAAMPMSILAKEHFCELPKKPLPQAAQDDIFLKAMFEADYVFRGRLFTYYDEKCTGDFCAYKGLVFKVLEDIENKTEAYIETTWVEDCQRTSLFPTNWRTDKETRLFKIKSEYLLIAKDTDKGIVIFGARKGLKLKELMMQYELARIGHDKKG